MKKKKAAKKKQRARPGPKADILKIDGDWKEAIKKSLTMKKPAGGWPK